MRFTELQLVGACLIEIEPLEDERGFFARTWCEEEFKQHQLISIMVQASIAYNYKKGTLRGLHFTAAPCREGKLVRCTRGSIYDVIVDIRPDSETFLQHFAVELTAQKRNALFVPPGFAHGYQTLEDDAEIFYQMTEAYKPGFSGGFRWDDTAFNIQWPIGEKIINHRDGTYPDFSTDQVRFFRGY